MRSRRFTLGVDGGATRCRVRIRDADGREQGAAEGPAANVYVDFDGGIAVIRRTMEEALAQAQINSTGTPDIAAGIGLAGVTSRVDEERVAARFSDFCEVVVASDAVAACLGAFGGADGGIVIAGTGSAALALIGGKRFEIGGRGFIIGDDGSAARIGCDALRRALRAHDGLAPHCSLARHLMTHFGNDPVAMTTFAQKARPSDFGAFAPTVFQFAAKGDPIGREVIGAASDGIAALVEATRRRGATRIALIGGLSEVIQPFLSERVAAALSPPLHEAVDGAILMAGGVIMPPRGGAP